MIIIYSIFAWVTVGAIVVGVMMAFSSDEATQKCSSNDVIGMILIWPIVLLIGTICTVFDWSSDFVRWLLGRESVKLKKD